MSSDGVTRIRAVINKLNCNLHIGKDGDFVRSVTLVLTGELSDSQIRSLASLQSKGNLVVGLAAENYELPLGGGEAEVVEDNEFTSLA